jgi:hypothetical protein
MEVRLKYVKGEGYPGRIIDLVKDARCHSEEEEVQATNSRRTVIYRTPIPERNPWVGDFFHYCSEQAQIQQEQLGKRGRVRRDAIDPPDGVIAERRFKTLPREKIPIDYFFPSAFNDFSLQIRAVYSVDKPCVAGPEESSWWTVRDNNRPHEAKTMKNKAFMKKYGEPILAKYYLPTQEELDAMEGYAADDESESESDSDESIDVDAFRRPGYGNISKQAEFTRQMDAEQDESAAAQAVVADSTDGAQAGPSGSGAGADSSVRAADTEEEM